MNIQIKDTVILKDINGYEDRETGYQVTNIVDDIIKLSTTLNDFKYLLFTITITKQSLSRLLELNRAKILSI